MSNHSFDANNVTPATARTHTRVAFQPSNVRGCVRCDLTRPQGPDWGLDEVAHRVYHAAAGMPPGVWLQLVVGADTPDYGAQIPSDVSVQVVAPDGITLSRWLQLVSSDAA